MEYIALGSIENEDEDAKIYLYFAMKNNFDGFVIAAVRHSPHLDGFIGRRPDLRASGLR
jgi:hypothetical protein